MPLREARESRHNHVMKPPLLVFAALALTALGPAQTPPMTPDIPASFKRPTANDNYERRVVMIAMRDGVKLNTVIVVPKGAKRAPMLFTRTPYNASKQTARNVSPNIDAILPIPDEVPVAHGYIRVYQDVRGKYKSQGDYVMTRPVRGPLNDTAVDHSTDAFDTIDWLVKNVPESNGRVGMTGSSYPGFTTLMGLIDPHPALKAAVPMSPMVDGWMGDDWFHNGAFRFFSLLFIARQNTVKGEGEGLAYGGYDDYETLLRAGSAADFAKLHGLDVLPFTKKLFEHPSYDAYWQGQAVDKLLAARKLTVPTMLVTGQWDQEDSYGAYAVYAAVEPQDTANNRVSLVIGPWRHSGVNAEGSTLGPLKLTGDTALEFRRDVMQPFLDQYLKDGAPVVATPPVWSYETGTNVWRTYDRWPLAGGKGSKTGLTPIYLQAGLGLGFAQPAGEGDDSYVSDPAKPVPFVPRPVRLNDPNVWRPWLVSDQRSFSDRPDVLTYITEPLKESVHIAGQPMVNLYAATSGTDSDWVVKLIDVYPEEVSSQPELGGYQLGIGMEIFRGRYRESFEKPSAIPAGRIQRYRFGLPNANHRFLPGHRIMVQIQSTWFPLYDRNPQTFVPNIFHAKAGDYQKATQRIFRGGSHASAIELPVVKD